MTPGIPPPGESELELLELELSEGEPNDNLVDIKKNKIETHETQVLLFVFAPQSDPMRQDARERQ